MCSTLSYKLSIYDTLTHFFILLKIYKRLVTNQYWLYWGLINCAIFAFIIGTFNEMLVSVKHRFYTGNICNEMQ